MDRNIIGCHTLKNLVSSLSARRAWIEINVVVHSAHPHKSSLSARRAWIEISTYVTRLPRAQVSLSARRAWIEIKSGLHPLIASLVALRKESVDRNNTRSQILIDVLQSLSARRAWIEIVLS